MSPEDQIKVIINYLKTDLEDCNNLKVACFPIFMTVSSGIDFLGGLIHRNGFGPGNSKDRYKQFIVEFMSQVDRRYSSSEFADYLYDYLRCKISHEACINGDLITKIDPLFEEKHLQIYNQNGTYQINIHPQLFKDDFLKSMEIFIEKYEMDQNFKNQVNQNYSNRAAVVINSVYSYRINYDLFGLQQTENLTFDGTTAPSLNSITTLNDNEQ